MKQCLSVVFLIPIIISAFGQPFGYASPLEGYRIHHEKYSYYRETGRIQEGKFKGEDGFNAILTFEYNAEELISGIKWIFYSPLYRISGIPFFNSTA